MEHSRRLAVLTGSEELGRLDQLFGQLLVRDVRGRLADWQSVEDELSAAYVALRGEAGDAPPGSTELEEAERVARRYAGSRSYLRSRDLQEENLRRMEHFPSLSKAAGEAVAAHADEFQRLSAVATGMALRVEPSAASLEWLSDFHLLDDVGSYGQPGWRDIPGAEVSAGSSPLARVGVARQHEWAPTEPDLALSPHAYIEDWRVWLLQVPLLYVGQELRLPPFLEEFRRVEGPFRLGLSAAVDASCAGEHRLAADGVRLFTRTLSVLATGAELTDAAAWAQVLDSRADSPAASTSGHPGPADDVGRIETLLDRFEKPVEDSRVDDAQMDAFQLAARPKNRTSPKRMAVTLRAAGAQQTKICAPNGANLCVGSACRLGERRCRTTGDYFQSGRQKASPPQRSRTAATAPTALGG